jgi:PEP-CTERM motif
VSHIAQSRVAEGVMMMLDPYSSALNKSAVGRIWPLGAPNMKKVSLALLLAVSLLVALSPASATLVPPFTSSPGVSLSSISSLPAGSLVASTGTLNFSFGTAANPNKNMGTVSEDVYRDSSGFLFFVFQVKVSGGPKGDIERLSTGDWANSIMINAEQYAPGSDKNAFGADRNGLGTVGINWNPLVTLGQTSSFVVLYTDAKLYIPGTIGLIDSGSSPSIDGFVAAATPEPATSSLLGLGLVGLGTFRKKLRK